MKKRILSMMLVLCMVLGMMPVSAFAAETDNLCDHHTEHTADCGYAPAVEGSPCTHECGEECAEACGHVHDELCGYVEAAAEVPCGYVCEESHGEATRVIYVDESTFWASGYSEFYDADGNQLTATREEQEDGWVKYTMPADAKYYLTHDGHVGGGGGGNYPELPTNADTYDPFSDTWSCSHSGYAEGNCRLCGEPCPGHTYDNACDDKCNVCSEIREVGDHVYDGAEDAECNECGYVRDITPVQITGVSITVDGVLYTEGNVTITPDSTVTLTVTGTNLHNGSDDHRVDYASGLYQPVNPDYFEISEDGTIATYTPHAKTFVNSSNFEITYYNNYTDSNNRITVPTGIYLTYDDSTGGEEDTTPAEITGVSITVDGVEYTEGEVTITPDTQSIIYTVTGMHFANLSENNNLSFAHGEGILVAPGYGWSIDTEANTATLDFSQRLSWFESCNNFEVKYSNDGNNTQIGTGIYLTYDDGTGGGEDTTPAEITGVSITVDGVTYTEGDVTITPTSTVVFTAIGTNFANASEDNILELGPGLTTFLTGFIWKIDLAANTATADFSGQNDVFEDFNGYEVMYSNDGMQSWTVTGIYLTYDDGSGGEEDTTPDSTGKILVEMTDNYGDGWNGAAIEIFKNGSLETTATVDEISNTVFLDYDSTATYEFKWVKGGYDYECSFTIYVDGEKELSVDDASSYAVGETILTLEATTKELAITQQPTDSEAKLGENYCVEVIAVGEGLTYQWYFRNAGTDVWHKSSVTDNTYDDVMTTARAGREVYCVITDSNGNSVTTETAKLIAVKTAELAIIQQPNDSSAKLDEMFCVEVLAEGDGLKYQWYWRQIGDENWTVSGQRDNTYDDVMTSARHNREVYCVITDAWGNTVETDPIVVILATPRYELAITAQPENESVKMGEMFCVTVEAQGDELKYQWYWRNVGSENWNVSGQRDNTYDDVMTKARHNREVKCVITDMWGESVETEIATITAIPNEVLAIVAQPTDAAAAMGENYCVTVEAQGDGLTYQWYFKNAGTDVWHVSGVKDNTYDDVMIESRAGRQVYCVITDIWGNTVTTETVTLVCTDIPQAIAKN